MTAATDGTNSHEEFLVNKLANKRISKKISNVTTPQ